MKLYKHHALKISSLWSIPSIHTSAFPFIAVMYHDNCPNTMYSPAYKSSLCRDANNIKKSPYILWSLSFSECISILLVMQAGYLRLRERTHSLPVVIFRGCVFVLRSLHTDQYDKTKFTYISNCENLKAAVTELSGV